MDTRELPAGTVTFVFTDIEGSTQLFRRLGDDYTKLLDRHKELLRRAWSAHEGAELGTEGDSFLVAFQRAEDAIAACAMGQRLLGEEPWGDSPVRVRMGVHSGLAYPRGGEYVALAVHQAARVVATGHGGQIVISAETAGIAGPVDDVQLGSLGSYRLRDFDAPVQLFAAVGAGLASGLPALRAVSADGHNIVVPLNRFVGREQELLGIAELVVAGSALTIVGAGGVGKSRLAAELGRGLAREWEDGVWLVTLAPIVDSALVPAAVAHALGVSGLPGGDITAEVRDHLRTRRAVLLLDNCEHQVDASRELVTYLLGACPGLAVLATSTRPLGGEAERVWRLSPLPVGQGAEAAVELFVERACSAQAEFAVTSRTEATIAAICRRLDGLPLAIELAAARVTVLSPAEILSGLDDRFRLLGTRDPTIPERQRTLTGLLDWSYDLLDEDQQAMLCRLAVLGGPFGLAAAAAVGGRDLTDVSDVVWSLVDTSLVVADRAEDATRYRLLETVRAYALTRVEDRAETARAARRLARWYLSRLGPHRFDRARLDEISEELHNIRAVIPLLGARSSELAQQLALLIGRYHDCRQSYREGIVELESYCSLLLTPSPWRVGLLAELANLFLHPGDIDAARRTFAEAGVVAGGLKDPPGWVQALLDLQEAVVLLREQRSAEAVTMARRAMAGQLDDVGRPRALTVVGLAAIELDDPSTAIDALTECLELNLVLDNLEQVAIAHANLAEAHFRPGNLREAARHQRECLRLAGELGLDQFAALSFILAARIQADEGRWADAARLHARADAMLEVLGIALFLDDRRLSDEMLARAREALGDPTYVAACEDGKADDLANLIEATEVVLRAVEAPAR